MFDTNKVKRDVLDKLVEEGLVDASLKDSLLDLLTDSLISEQLNAAMCGQHDASKLAFYDAFSELLPEVIAKLEGHMEVAKSSGWWWPLTEVAILTERPVELHLDPENRLHNADGPVLMYPDGHATYAWHGTKIPAEWIEDKENLDPKTALHHENVEMRRIAAEIIGWEKIIKSLNPTVVDEDKNPQIGTLLKVDLPDAPGSLFLKVQCGTGRTFVLPCVHNEFKTALEANAASWGDTGISPELVQNLQIRT